MSKAINQESFNFQTIEVPTDRHGVQQDGPFSHISLSSRQVDVLRYAIVNGDEDGVANNEVDKRTRYSVEVHPMRDAMFGIIAQELHDDLTAGQNLVEELLLHVYSLQ